MAIQVKLLARNYLAFGSCPHNLLTVHWY